MYRTCIHIKDYKEAECKVFLSAENTSLAEHIEDDVQKYTTFISTVQTVLQSVVPAILSFYLGPWSDSYGRKPLLVWPLLGRVCFILKYELN